MNYNIDYNLSDLLTRLINDRVTDDKAGLRHLVNNSCEHADNINVNILDDKFILEDDGNGFNEEDIENIVDDFENTDIITYLTLSNFKLYSRTLNYETVSVEFRKDGYEYIDEKYELFGTKFVFNYDISKDWFMEKCKYADANITIHEEGETYQTGNQELFDTENYHKFYEDDDYKIMESMFVDNKVLVGNILYDEQTKYDAISKQVKLPDKFLDMNEIDRNHINTDIDYEIERKLDNKSTYIEYNGLTLIDVELEDNNLYIDMGDGKFDLISYSDDNTFINIIRDDYSSFYVTIRGNYVTIFGYIDNDDYITSRKYNYNWQYTLSRMIKYDILRKEIPEHLRYDSLREYDLS